jgi:hypothetical protein
MTLGSSLKHIVATVGTEVIVERHCYGTIGTEPIVRTLLQLELRSLLEYIVAIMVTKVIVVRHCYCWMTLLCNIENRPLLEHCCNRGNQGYFWGTFLQQWELKSLLAHNDDIRSHCHNSDLGYHCCLCSLYILAF